MSPRLARADRSVTSVLIIDDHPFVIQGCKRILEVAGINLVFSAADVANGYALYQQKRPDLVVVDLSFGGDALAGLSLVRRIRADDPTTRVIVFSMHDDPAIVQHCLSAGASDYVVKDACSTAFLKAVQRDLDSKAPPVVDADDATMIAARQPPARPI
jgi:two-component system, NarL family, invasion response regulator UvrY